jgi:FixJ family two-component response regulator
MGATLPLIAVIDDDEAVRRALRRLLRSLGFEPVVFASGEEFLRNLPACGPRCVVMDLHLPGLSGFEVLGRLRDNERVPPVIVMTGFDETGTRERCLAAGAVDYLTKPLDGAGLSAAIGRALG